MTELEFRCWDNSRKEMKEVNSLTISNGVTQTLIAHFKNSTGFDYDIVNGESGDIMQFTRLKDRHGKKIWIGDILQTSNNGIDGCDVWSALDFGYAVCYANNKELGIYFEHWHPSSDEDSVYNLKYCEVIGNIYENPELINN